MTETAHLDTFARDNLPPREHWPDLIFALPELRYPARLNCVSQFLDRWIAEGHGHALCLVGEHESLTYRQFFERVNRIANVLVNRLGLRPGNRVLLRSGNTPALVAAYLAVIKAGGIVVATMPMLRARELAYPLNKARIALALCDHRLADEMERARPLAPGLERVVYWGSGAADSLEALAARESPAFTAVDTAADDICLIAFTSGTTGEPKGAMHFHRDMLAICDTYARHVVRAVPEDRFIGSAPLAFTFGLAIVLFPMRIGATGIVLELAGPDALAAAIARERATICFTAPTAYRAILRRIGQCDLSSLRRCISAGEALPRPTFEAWEAATGLKLLDGIGGTEMLHIYLSASEDQVRPGATGRPVPGFEARVVDDEGRELPPGTVGRLAVRGPIGCRYLADARQTAYVADGWNYPGDSYLMDEDGYFWYQARTDDMIVSSGYNIAGPEVEAALLGHPGVAECAVVGAPDPERGTIVKAYVVPAPAALPGPDLAQALQDFVKTEIAPYKYPRAIEFVEALPKTASGKVQRFALRRLAAAAAAVTVPA
ncbi:AMP-binding protein [Methylobacterium nodulans]|uniref:AMP-dependent synthetase and ligase n=1 Tax=Methylobacterium nodulans (strain LMG 21967 / CNCM I-2342 / ORS 2060) TaxID=460265 RepID=B8IKJ9_METNO|nr:AMP-binding protein [Methylobacterium nodulans]ACL56206.1 AMP-dependent synthetase and ligase [Methylobacterium nodulans ORS 2060]